MLFLNAVKIMFLLTQMRSFALGLPEGDFTWCLQGSSNLCTARERFQSVAEAFFEFGRLLESDFVRFFHGFASSGDRSRAILVGGQWFVRIREIA